MAKFEPGNKLKTNQNAGNSIRTKGHATREDRGKIYVQRVKGGRKPGNVAENIKTQTVTGKNDRFWEAKKKTG